MEPGTVTHAQVGSLDLVISSGQMTKEVYQCYIDPNADTTSDHEAIITKLEINRQPRDKNHLSKFQVEKLDEKVFKATLLAKSDLVKASLENAKAAQKNTAKRQNLIDQAADVLVQAIHSSLTLSTCRVMGASGREPWWNETCQDVVQKVRNYWREILLEEDAGIDNPGVGEKLKTLRNKLRKQVKSAKKRYYQDVINGLTSKTIFQAVKWPNTIQTYTTPPIQKADDTLAVSNQDKQEALRSELLSAKDLFLGSNSDSTTARSFFEETRAPAPEWHTCIWQEVEKAVFSTGNTLAGMDEIPPMIVKKAWPVVKEEITLLFQLCLDEEHHPLAFETAVLCALPKPGLRSKHLPRLYQLIALLSCLGKALEKVVARRLSEIAIRTRLISPIHFGAVARCLAVDAAAMLTHDKEKAWQDSEMLTTLAFDIKGAFDTITEKILTACL